MLRSKTIRMISILAMLCFASTACSSNDVSLHSGQNSKKKSSSGNNNTSNNTGDDIIDDEEHDPILVRFATFNTSLERPQQGALIADLSTTENAQAKVIAEIIQRVRPEVLLLNEFDYDENGRALENFHKNYLQIGQNGADPISYEYSFLAPSNTGVPSGFDLDNNGVIVSTPGSQEYGNDSFGFGRFEGHYGMAVLSKYPIDKENARTFQKFLWKDMPGALLPSNPTTQEDGDWYSPAALEVVRLSSKSHWDVPVKIGPFSVHLLASHPTPPAFDGMEQRNVRRNHDEVRFWVDYISEGQADYIYDDLGTKGGLDANASFVIAGDLNADPHDGGGNKASIKNLLAHNRVNTSITPSSEGGLEQGEKQGGANEHHEGNHAHDTADFEDRNVGNLRVDYALPSSDLELVNAGVFWPKESDPQFELIGQFPFPGSDHRLVWVDVMVK